MGPEDWWGHASGRAWRTLAVVTGVGFVANLLQATVATSDGATVPITFALVVLAAFHLAAMFWLDATARRDRGDDTLARQLVWFWVYTLVEVLIVALFGTVVLIAPVYII